MTKRVSLEQAQAELPQLLDEMAETGERLIIERPGKPDVALQHVVGPQHSLNNGVNQTDEKQSGGLLALLDALAGSMSDEDVDEMLAVIYADRERGIPQSPALERDA